MVDKVNETPVMAYITSSYPALTKSEKKVADFVLSEPVSALYSSIADIAAHVGVGDATILRFCKKIGKDSFYSFKYALAVEVHNGNIKAAVLNTEFAYDDPLDTVVEKVIASEKNALSDTKALLSETSLEQAADLIINAEKVQFVGVGSSLLTAEEATMCFLRAGISSICFKDYHVQIMAASLLGETDVIFGISHSGETAETLAILRQAKQSGAKIICLTHYARSNITKISDVYLLHGSEEGPLQGGNFATKIAQLSAIDALYHAVFQKMGDAAVANRERTSNALLGFLP